MAFFHWSLSRRSCLVDCDWPMVGGFAEHMLPRAASTGLVHSVFHFYVSCIIWPATIQGKNIYWNPPCNLNFGYAVFLCGGTQNSPCGELRIHNVGNLEFTILKSPLPPSDSTVRYNSRPVVDQWQWSFFRDLHIQVFCFSTAKLAKHTSLNIIAYDLWHVPSTMISTFLIKLPLAHLSFY